MPLFLKACVEDPELVKYFSDLIGKLKEKGHSDGAIRASFHEAAPKLVWQERAYLGIVDSAAIFFGILTVSLIMVGSIFGNSSIIFELACLLLFSGALLYYFAIGAFKFHAGEKLAMTVVVTFFLSSFAWLFEQLLTKFFDPLVATIQAKVAELPPQTVISSIGGETTSRIVAQGSGLLSVFSNERIALSAMILLIVLAYNLVPLIFFVVEKVRSHAVDMKQ